MSVEHYENFPVASILCPPALRPAVSAIYHFARTADDLADEGDAPAATRLADLAAFRQDLTCALAGQATSPRWAGLFAHLARQARAFALPAQPLHDLISAFEQDVRHTAAGHWYHNHEELLDYCRLSANPVGRLMLHLFGVHDAPALVQSDAICSALQLANFWQDLSVDVPRGRYYLPLQDLHHAAVTPDMVLQRTNSHATAQLVAGLVDRACEIMARGQALPARVAGRSGWELRLVVQGGLRILEKTRAQRNTAMTARPRLGPADVVLMCWRALRMA